GSLTPSITPEIAAGTKGENETGTGSPLVLGEDSTLKLREQELNKILKPEKTTKNENSGLINESKEQQGKLKWNLLIFILFLIALVVWVFWVNKELIKEKKAQAKKEEQQDDNIQDKLI
ncbi:MAG: hypothetical protein NTW06_01215, partial [Candidatus Falkowbacteria bacterium]|nr:hypothetical protein [Candidatus Falkowbacteria bacterium]